MNVIIIPVLHPKHKLKYFTKTGWDKAWIKTVEKIIRDKFKRSYKDYVIPNTSKAGDALVSKKVCIHES